MIIRVKSAVALITNAPKRSNWEEVERMRLKMQLRYGKEFTFGDALLWV